MRIRRFWGRRRSRMCRDDDDDEGVSQKRLSWMSVIGHEVWVLGSPLLSLSFVLSSFH